MMVIKNPNCAFGVAFLTTFSAQRKTTLGENRWPAHTMVGSSE